MMNKTGIQSKLLLTAVALLTLGFNASTNADTGMAEVTSVTGGATFDSGSGASALSVGTKVSAGTVITTNAGGEVTFNIQNSGTLKVKANSTVILDRLNYESTGSGIVIDTQLDLRDGCILGSVNEFQSDLSKYEVKVPTGVVGIDASDESTSFHICTPNEIGVLQGWGVYVYTRDGVVRSVRIGGGNQFNPPTDSPTPIPPAVLGPLETEIGTIVPPPQPPVTPPTQVVTRPYNFFISPPGSAGSGGGAEGGN